MLETAFPACLPRSSVGVLANRQQGRRTRCALKQKKFAMAQSIPQPPPLVMDAGEMLSAQPSPRAMDAGEIATRQRVAPRTPRTPRPSSIIPRPPISPGNDSTSQSGAFLTEPPQRSSPNFSDKVESCEFPGIDDCGELPRGCKPAREIMREGTLLVHFASRSHEVQFGHCWASKPCEEMLVAFVWHVVCQHFKPG